MKNKTSFFIIALMVWLAGCASKEPSTSERLNAASLENRQHQDSVGLVSSETEPSAALSGASASVLNQGETAPEWVLRVPADEEFYYSVSFLECPADPNTCREEAETHGRDALRKTLSVEVSSATRSVEQSRIGGDGQAFQKEYEAVIRERGRKMELEDVTFVHFYHTPTRQLQTLTRMPRQDRLERELQRWAERNAGQFPTPLRVGFFPVKGERMESLLSFHTGEFLYQQLSVRLKEQAGFNPAILGESEVGYWKRISEEIAEGNASSRGAVLYGNYLALEGKLKLSLYLKTTDTGPRFLDSLEIRSSSLTRQLLSITRASVTSVEKVKTRWKHYRILLLRDSGDPKGSAEEGLSLFASEAAEIAHRSGLTPAQNALAEWRDLRGNALREKVREMLAKQPDTLVLSLSLSGKMSPQSGLLYQGLTTVYLKTSVYTPDGSPLWNGHYEAKRFMTEDPDSLGETERADNYRKTTEKGLLEYRETLASQLLQLITQ